MTWKLTVTYRRAGGIGRVHTWFMTADNIEPVAQELARGADAFRRIGFTVVGLSIAENT
jgi:hypothetical protein